jgi:monofunctional biosynthetic peptidoglycan transglycosylase
VAKREGKAVMGKKRMFRHMRLFSVRGRIKKTVENSPLNDETSNNWLEYWLKYLLLRAAVILSSGALLLLLLFAVLPVPFSAVMLERQFSAWFDGDSHYVAHSRWVPLDQISPAMSLAVIAGEDQKFPHHWGFDFSAIQQAIDDSQDNDDKLRGASTLSQQTAKNMFLWDGHSWLRKALEAGFTLGIEGLWGKRRILTVYLNIAEFGEGIFGVEQASHYYFNKPASRLTAAQAALLAAVLPNPHRYKVNAPSAYVQRRQAWILKQMGQLGNEAFLQENHLR